MTHRSFASGLHLPHGSNHSDLPFWYSPLPGTVPHSSGLRHSPERFWNLCQLPETQSFPLYQLAGLSVHSFSRDKVPAVCKKTSQSWMEPSWLLEPPVVITSLRWYSGASHHRQPALVPKRTRLALEPPIIVSLLWCPGDSVQLLPPLLWETGKMKCVVTFTYELVLMLRTLCFLWFL